MALRRFSLLQIIVINSCFVALTIKHWHQCCFLLIEVNMSGLLCSVLVQPHVFRCLAFEKFAFFCPVTFRAVMHLEKVLLVILKLVFGVRSAAGRCKGTASRGDACPCRISLNRLCPQSGTLCVCVLKKTFFQHGFTSRMNYVCEQRLKFLIVSLW